MTETADEQIECIFLDNQNIILLSSAYEHKLMMDTVMILSFRTDQSGQIVQTQI